MTAREAAGRMGVKVETLYAYVSRGLLPRAVAADGRTSVFDVRDVESLARRGRPRTSSRDTSLSLLVETRITELTPQGVRYRGHLAAELARACTFEQVAELLWTGELPVRHRSWPLPAASPCPVAAASRVDAMRVLVAAAGAADPGPHPLDPAGVAAVGRSLIASTLVGPAGDTARVPRLQLRAGAPLAGTVAGRLWRVLSPRQPRAMLPVLNAALVLLADHDLATSTLGVRVAASTRADPYAAVSAGLGVLRGPLHGGASAHAHRLLAEVGQEGAPRAVAAWLAEQPRLPAFGHQVYADADPRADQLFRMMAALPAARRTLALVGDLRATALERTGRHPNIDLALAAFTFANGMAPDAGEAIMATARIAGWLAHAIEEYGEAPLRFRPRSRYVGP